MRPSIVSVFRAHYTGGAVTDPLNDGAGSRAHELGAVDRLTIDTIVQRLRDDTHGPITLAWVANVIGSVHTTSGRQQMATRGFQGRRSPTESKRLPPGQYETRDFPVLSAGPTPHT